MPKLSELKLNFKSELSSGFSPRELSQLFQIFSEEIFGLSRIQQLTEAHFEVSEEKLKEFNLALQRLKNNEPYQYIFSKSEFRGLEFYVDTNVLIPRPETEELVSEVISCLNPNDKVIDLGTGSGCIAVSLKSEFPAAEVWALDISEGAVEVAKKNAKINNAEINLLVTSMDNSFSENLKFDVIVSNPPYIGMDEKELLNKNVTSHEPHMALFSITDDPLYFYKEIEKRAQESLVSGGFIFLELHENYAEQTKELFLNSKYASATLINDLQGKQRILKVVKN